MAVSRRRAYTNISDAINRPIYYVLSVWPNHIPKIEKTAGILPAVFFLQFLACLPIAY